MAPRGRIACKIVRDEDEFTAFPVSRAAVGTGSGGSAAGV